MKTNEVGDRDVPAAEKTSFADVVASDVAAAANAAESEANVSADAATEEADSIAEDDVYYDESNPAVRGAAENQPRTERQQNAIQGNQKSQTREDEDFRTLVKRETREQVSRFLEKLSERVERALEEGYVKGRNAAIEQRWPELKSERREKQPLERLFRRRESVWK